MVRDWKALKQTMTTGRASEVLQPSKAGLLMDQNILTDFWKRPRAADAGEALDPSPSRGLAKGSPSHGKTQKATQGRPEPVTSTTFPLAPWPKVLPVGDQTCREGVKQRTRNPRCRRTKRKPRTLKAPPHCCGGRQGIPPAAPSLQA